MILRLFRRRVPSSVEQFASARIPTSYGEFTVHAYVSDGDQTEHVAFVMGDVVGGDPPLVRLHSNYALLNVHPLRFL